MTKKVHKTNLLKETVEERTDMQHEIVLFLEMLFNNIAIPLPLRAKAELLRRKLLGITR